MRFGHCLDDGKAEAGAGASARGIGTAETLERPRCKGFGKALTLVGDVNLDAFLPLDSEKTNGR